MIFADPKVQAVYEAYEARNSAEAARVRSSGASGFNIRDELLLPVGAEVGRILHALILGCRPARILELGTSYGYSTLFLADAARQVGAVVISMEHSDYKQAEAQRQLTAAGLADHVEFRLGDAVALIGEDEGPFDFVLLDIWKELYLPCFEAFYPKLADEGMIVADNMIFPPMAREDVRAYRAAVRSTGDMHQTLLPVGMGIEIAVKWPADSAKL
jgi:predicted O-methyltransferase YrrM